MRVEGPNVVKSAPARENIFSTNYIRKPKGMDCKFTLARGGCNKFRVQITLQRVMLGGVICALVRSDLEMNIFHASCAQLNLDER